VIVVLSNPCIQLFCSGSPCAQTIWLHHLAGLRRRSIRTLCPGEFHLPTQEIAMKRSLRNGRRLYQDQQLARAAEIAEARTLLSAAAIDGSGNNVENPEWGSTDEQFLRLAEADYADEISAVNGEDRPGAREISNALADSVGQDTVSDRLMSAMMYVWGQFIDHDMTLTAFSKTESLSIPVPVGDPSFDPAGTGTATINTFRSGFDSTTGADSSNPREQINELSAFLDGSMVYGSDDATAASLRTFNGGRMLTSDGDLLPIDDTGSFLAGDIRANENIELTAMQTLFVREHNFQADRLAAANPDLSDEEIYQQARAIVIAEIQAITYTEWLPALLGDGAISAYSGYDATVNPGISNEFATAAFRFGHSLLGDDIEFLDNNGLATRDEVSLAEAFFNPSLVSENGIDGILKYLVSDPSSELDTQLVDSVRNFLFGPPGAGGLDLASLNIQRGRDHGLADYNTVRESIGLPRVTSFSDISSDTEVQSKLQALYGSVDNIDLWVGGLAEDHLPDSSLGETFTAIIVDQFERLRNGDRYWFQNQFSGEQLSEIESTSLSDIIERNTSLTSVQDNAFFFKAGISGLVTQDLNRDGRSNPKEPPLAGSAVHLIDTETGDVVASTTTDRKGRYAFEVEDGLRTGMYRVEVIRQDGTVASASGNIAITTGDDFETVNLSVAAQKPTKTPPPVRRSKQTTPMVDGKSSRKGPDAPAIAKNSGTTETAARRTNTPTAPGPASGTPITATSTSATLPETPVEAGNPRTAQQRDRGRVVEQSTNDAVVSSVRTEKKRDTVRRTQRQANVDVMPPSVVDELFSSDTDSLL
jgi:peroxidase